MDRRLAKLEFVYQRRERAWRPKEPIDWHQVPNVLPVCFAPLSETERAEWATLMTDYSAPGAYDRHKDDRAFFARLAELDTKIDWDEGLYRPMHAGQERI